MRSHQRLGRKIGVYQRPSVVFFWSIAIAVLLGRFCRPDQFSGLRKLFGSGTAQAVR
jgi:hypothetical protein